MSQRTLVSFCPADQADHLSSFRNLSRKADRLASGGVVSFRGESNIDQYRSAAEDCLAGPPRKREGRKALPYPHQPYQLNFSANWIMRGSCTPRI